jgi:signal recognition particle subunit SRP19
VDEEKAWVLWPEYFDINLTRGEGRKVKKTLAIAQPSTELISKACQSLGLEQGGRGEGVSWPMAP